MKRTAFIALAIVLSAAGCRKADAAAPHHSRDHHSREHHSTRADPDRSYWGRHVDAYRDHRYGDPTVHKLTLKPAYRSPRDDYDGDGDGDMMDDDIGDED